LSCIRFQKTCNHLDCGGFAGTVWAKKTEYFPPTDCKAYIVNRIEIAELFGQVLYGKHVVRPIYLRQRFLLFNDGFFMV
jgi:hypothetical protein